jgi:hypothetical protein
LFGINVSNQILTLNEYFNTFSNAFLDFISGFFYLLWMPAPIFFGLYLMMKKPEYVVEFGFVFLLANLIGFVGYYSYPAAPPWYFAKFGEILDTSMPSNPANLVKFDKLTGTTIFADMYTKGSNVFAAIPSLHAAYPLVTLFFSLKYGNIYTSALLAIIMIGIWFAAIYSFHHYIIDVILGIFCALLAIFLYEKFISKSKFYNKILTFARRID